MIDVSVREDHRIERRRVDAQLRVLTSRLGAMTLDEAAIERDALPANVEHVERARDRPSRTEERDAHAIH